MMKKNQHYRSPNKEGEQFFEKIDQVTTVRVERFALTSGVAGMRSIRIRHTACKESGILGVLAARKS